MNPIEHKKPTEITKQAESKKSTKSTIPGKSLKTAKSLNLNEITWPAYLRADGRKGIRNKVLIIYTVECSSFVAQEIGRKMDHQDVDVIGFDGCTDNEYAIRLLISLISHPNVGGVLAVGLGCEYTQADRLCQVAAGQGKQADYFLIQEAGGTRKSIDRGCAIVTRMLEKLKETPRTTMGFSELIVGAECGGSDFTSGLAGNVVVGRFYDSLVDMGGTPIFEEIVEAVGLIDILKSRAADETARKELEYTYSKALSYCKSVHQYSVSPGNFAGGLSTIEEKSMGAVVKSGSRPIQGVIKVAQMPPHPGLWLLDSTPDPHFMQFGITNPNDNEGLMDLISCGAHLVFLVTGRGNVVGSAVSPVIKITGNHNTFVKLNDDMDFDASPVLEGHCSIDELANELGLLVADFCSGSLTKSEQLGHKEFFIPYKYQDKTVTVTNQDTANTRKAGCSLHSI